MRPAEYLILTPGSLPKRQRYFRYIYNPETETRLTDEQLKEEFDEVMLTAFLRMVKSAPKDTQWAIPLSGGIDSRLIVNYLKRLNVENVCCYSYGVPGNSQSVISENVAVQAGYSYEFVKYTEEKWDALHRNGLFDSYIHFAFNGDSIPHFQDFLAVHELKERGLVNKQTIFVPGHNLGFLSDFVSKDDMYFHSAEEVADSVLRKNVKFALNGTQTSRMRQQVIRQILDEKIPLRSYMEYFLWENRHCKFTANSVRVYEYFGFQWRMPYWDRSMIDFWLTTDLERRADQNFYKKMVRSNCMLPQIRSIPYAVNHNPVRRRFPVGFTNRLRPVRTNRFADLLISAIFGKKNHVGEGLTQMYATRASRIGRLIGPIHLWPKDLRPAILKIKNRNTTRINYHVLTALYTIHKLLQEKR
jgi:asparagine synthase (glutamine-hydrolysing)